MTVLTHEITVRCPVEHAFAVFTGQVDVWWPPSHRRWPDSELHLERSPPARLVERHPSGQEHILGLLLDIEPPRRLRFAWHLGASPDTATRVEVTFEGAEAATRVRVEHRQGPVPLPDWARTARVFNQAWPHVLSSLAHTLEGP